MAEFFPVYWNRENFKSFRKDVGLSAQDGPFSVELSAILIVLPGDFSQPIVAGGGRRFFSSATGRCLCLCHPLPELLSPSSDSEIH